MEADNEGLNDTNRILFAAGVAEHAFWIFGYDINIGRPGDRRSGASKAQIYFLIDEEDCIHAKVQPSNSEVFGSTGS